MKMWFLPALVGLGSGLLASMGMGVGFRYQAMYACRAYGATGWVENLPDGSVEMEVQGTPAAIGKVLTHLRSGHWIRIDDMEVEEIPLANGERGFDVRGY